MRSSMIHATLIQLDTVYWSTSILFFNELMVASRLFRSILCPFALRLDFSSLVVQLPDCYQSIFSFPPALVLQIKTMMKPQQFRSICWWLPDKWCDVASWHWRTMTNWKVKLAEGYIFGVSSSLPSSPIDDAPLLAVSLRFLLVSLWLARIIKQYQTHTNRPKSCGISLLVKQLHLNHAKHSLSQEVCWIQGHPMTRPLISPPIGTPNGKSPFLLTSNLATRWYLRHLSSKKWLHTTKTCTKPRNHLLTTPFLLLPTKETLPALDPSPASNAFQL